MTATNHDPDLRIAGFALWVDARTAPESDDYWDGNWLQVRASYEASDSSVRAAGALVHASELVTLAAGCRKLLAGEAAEAGLYCSAPNLKLELWSAPGGAVIGKLRITPDHQAELHDYGFATDNVGLQALVAASERVLTRFPLRGKH
ncbi:MAG: hypothetical protein AB7I01_14430 [Gammaproteobacteria bacterium]